MVLDMAIITNSFNIILARYKSIKNLKIFSTYNYLTSITDTSLV